MRAALVQASIASFRGEVPVGAVMVHQGKIISATHNRVEADMDATAHAELLCIREASQSLGVLSQLVQIAAFRRVTAEIRACWCTQVRKIRQCVQRHGVCSTAHSL